MDLKEAEGVQDAQGSRVRREPEDFLDIRENTERMGLMDWMGKRAFVDFPGKREKKVMQVPREAQVPEVPLGDMERRVSQGNLVIQDKATTSKDKRAPKESKEDKVEPGRKGRKAVLAPEGAGGEKARGESRVPWGNRARLDLKAHQELKDCKAHREQADLQAGKERRGTRDTKDLRVLLDQQEIKGVLEGLVFWGKRENLGFLEIQGQQGKWDGEESRVTMASQAMVLWDEKESRVPEDSLEIWAKRVMLVILEFLGGLDPKDLED